ncbi:uncharacterized protein EDB91DRAFT_1045429, partial [Suillus paluster]|uniref:uncharacterized protein n=1 Tax=Suillus paluster TaxID=48578 RepID=UPI001B87DEE0
QVQPTSLPTRIILHVFDSIHMCFNRFGIACEYHHRPSYDLDAIVSADELSNICWSPGFNVSDNSMLDVEAHSGDLSSWQPPWPWQNMSVWRLMSWMVTGSDQKLMAEVKHLVNNVIKVEDFNLHNFEHFNLDVQTKNFDNSEDSADMGVLQRDGWKQANVEIMVPSKGKNPGGNGHPFSVSGLFYRPLIAVIQVKGT